MTDDGLMFTATIRTANGADLHRETPSRTELLEWIGAHAGDDRGRLVRVGMEATEAAASRMLGAIVFGAMQLAGASPRPSFTCPQCGRTSYNQNDIRERYCGACHAFVDDRHGGESAIGKSGEN